MGMTGRQQQIINQRKNSVLVSAAAGSGKTTVLVERIIQKVTDKKNPVDIDSFLVVTFTKAAAASMKEKIAEKLEKLLEKEPDNEHLLKQILLVNRADITTIDSFCLKLVKENFSMLDLDSSFSIGDEGMMALMKNDILDQLFEDKYRDETFKMLVDIFARDKDKDDGLKEAILEIYNKADSYTMPLVWLKNAKEALEINCVEDVEKTKWYTDTIRVIKGNISGIYLLMEQAYQICDTPGGPDYCVETLEADKEALKPILSANSYQEFKEAFQIEWKRVKTCKKDGYDPDLKKQFMDIRQKYKTMVKKMNIFKSDQDTLMKEFKSLQEYLLPLIDLTLEFYERFETVKKERRLVTFSDVEHMAFQLVCSSYDEKGQVIPTELAKEISKRYEEIYIDEYQDSNFLQEDILCAISRVHMDEYNMFMVGDVKQSIYRFRLARPDLFMGKYGRFTDISLKDEQSEDIIAMEGQGGKVESEEMPVKEALIELKENFRSRKEVLEPVNFFFYQLMGEDLGGIRYSKEVALVPGLQFMDAPSEIDGMISKNMELLVATENESAVLSGETSDKSDFEENSKVQDDFREEDEQQVNRRFELEAHMVGRKIFDMVKGDEPLYVYDDDLKKYRRVSYKDIVILGRSIKDFGTIMYEILASYGIPVYLEDPKGYFNAVEIKVTMSMLSIIDNIRQDIPLAAVLLSPMCNLTEEELAIICAFAREQKNEKREEDNDQNTLSLLYEKCKLYQMHGNNPVLIRKLETFFSKVYFLKEQKKKVSISELIWMMLQQTGYYVYASAMPMGQKRRANLDMLIEKAKAFENGYYKGLFHFLRYVEKLKVNDVDFGEANLLGENEDVVRIMTMHKSKGLEYPVVFVSGLGKGFNKQDSKSNLVIHPDYYLSANQMNHHKRYKRHTFIRDCFRLLIETENMAEELRVLYVAMTRAKEKLILTGCTKDIDALQNRHHALENRKEVLLPYSVRRGPKSFLDLIWACMQRVDYLSKEMGVDWDIMIKATIYPKESILKGILKNETRNENVYKDLFLEANQFTKEELENDVDYRKLKSQFEEAYSFHDFTKIKSKMSFSDVKKMREFDGDDFDELFMENETEKQNYSTIKKEERENGCLTGAQRGVIFHKFMELIPFEEFHEDMSYADVINMLQKKKSAYITKGIFTETEASVISVKKVATMILSPLGQRMCEAAKKKDLFKEQQFSAGILACQMNKELEKTDDMVIVQGIIDAYFYENDEIVVVDYKTDYADEETLRERHRVQIDYYASIIHQLTGKKIKEKIIYSFFLNKVLILQ